jgi:multidrug efflux pump subunit AcrA (membrane-fusion protein)
VKWLVIAALVFAGCGKKKQQDQPPPAPTGSAAMTGSAPAPVPVATAGSAAGSAVDVPTEQDFEDQAAKDITDKNVDSKLKAIESDLAH